VQIHRRENTRIFKMRRTIVKLVLRKKDARRLQGALRSGGSRSVTMAISVSHRCAALTCSVVSVSAESLPIGARRPPLQLQNASKIWYHWLNRDGVIGFLELRADRG
jgi:hypothetical protein